MDQTGWNTDQIKMNIYTYICTFYNFFEIYSTLSEKQFSQIFMNFYGLTQTPSPHFQMAKIR